MVGVEPYVLRFWETQFSFIRPRQSRSRHRFYNQRDVETLKIVKHLLHTEGYTIAGARRFVRENGLDGVKNRLPLQPPASGRKTNGRLNADSEESSPNAPLRVTNNGVYRALREIREDLRAIHKLLESG
jgi:DNA-binding transcriptional MerR regulator